MSAPSLGYHAGMTLREAAANLSRELDRTYCADDVPQGMREIVIEVAR